MGELLARQARREKILNLQALVQELPQYRGELKHHFAPGLYAREFSMQAGSLIFGKVHLHAHINSLIKGTCVVQTEHGEERIEAPHVWTSTPGDKRAVFNETDVTWVTYHPNPTNERDISKLEAMFVVDTHEEYEQVKLLEEL
jgi:hypothetical protein